VPTGLRRGRHASRRSIAQALRGTPGKQRAGIGPVIAPRLAQGCHIHQVQHRHHDDGGKNRLGHITEQRREIERRQPHQDRSENPGEWRARPGRVVDHRAAESPGHRHGPGECRPQVGDPQSDQFLIRIDPLAAPVGQHLGHRHALHITDQRNQGGGR
jgi:hypothetical protein